MSTPEIRFEEFTGDWRKKAYGDYFSEKNESFIEGELLSVTTRHGLKKFSDVGRHDTSNDDKSKYKLVEPGDIAYNSMRMWQGASGISKWKGIVSPAYTVISPKSDVNGVFFSYLLKNPDQIHQFLMNSQGLTSDTWNLKFQEFSKLLAFSPNFIEQEIIGLFLNNLDRLRDSAESTVQKTKLLKQSMLVKMFPQDGASVPEVRFEGFTGDWSGGKLGDATSEFTYGLNAAATTFDGETKYLRITDIDDQSRRFINENATSPSASAEKIKPYFLQQNDILFARTGASVGKTFIYKETDGTMVYAGFLIRAKINDNYSPDFVFQFTQSSNYWKYIKLVSQRSGQPGVNASEYANCPILFPSKEEQTAIGSYFRQLDKLIELEETKLAKLTQLKTAFLSKMFV